MKYSIIYVFLATSLILNCDATAKHRGAKKTYKPTIKTAENLVLKLAERKRGESVKDYIARVKAFKQQLDSKIVKEVEIELDVYYTPIYESSEYGDLWNNQRITDFAKKVITTKVQNKVDEGTINGKYIESVKDFVLTQFLAEFRSEENVDERTKEEAEQMVNNIVDKTLNKNAGFIHNQWK